MATMTPNNESAQNFLQGEAIQTLLKFLKDNGTLVALVVLMLIFSFWDESFFTPRNLTNLARYKAQLIRFLPRDTQ